MRPLLLEMTAFGPYARPLTLDFNALGNEQIFLITGPTGAGKSTIFDGIFYALYGKAPAGGRQGNWRSDFPEAASYLTSVRYTFMIGEKSYRIYRQPAQEVPRKRGDGMRQEGHKVTLEALDQGGFAPLSKVDEVERKVRELIGLDAEQFEKIVMLPQGEFRRFLLADTKEKSAILRHLFGTERYRRFRELCHQRVSTTKASLLLAEDRLQGLVEQLRSPLGHVDTKRLLQEDQRRLAALKAAQAYWIKEKEQQDKALSEGRVTARLYEEWESLKAEGEALALEAAEREHEHRIMDNAKKAEPLLDKEEAQKEADQTLSDAKQAWHTGQEKEKALAAALQMAQEQWRKAEVAQAEQEDRRVQMQEMQASLQRLLALEEARQRKDTAWQTWHPMAQAVQEKEQALSALEASMVARERERQAGLRLTQDLPIAERVFNAAEEQLAAMSKAWREAKAAYQARRQYSESTQEIEAAEAAVASAYQAWQEGLLAERRDLAQQLAADLKEGEPCPLCGALHHPKPLREEQALSHGSADGLKEVWDKALAELQRKKATATEAATTFQLKQQALQASYGQVYPALQRPLTEQGWQDFFVWIRSQGQELRQQADKAKAERDRLQQALADHQVLLNRLADDQQCANEWKAALVSLQIEAREAEQTYLACVARERVLADQSPEGDAEQWQQQLQDLQREYQTIEERVQVARQAEKEAAQALAVHQARQEERAQHVKQERERQVRAAAAFEKAWRSTFADLAAYQEAKEALTTYETLAARWQSYQERCTYQQRAFAEKEAALADRPRVDIDILQKTVDETQALSAEMAEAIVLIEERHRHNQQTAERIHQQEQTIAEMRQQYEQLLSLDRLCAGDNPLRMDLETFILIGYFETVLARANERLWQMSDHRFLLERRMDVKDRRRTAGLDLDIMDHHTGRARPVETLSGGESFKASLALALGLADVVSEESGGLRMDAIFIDEGFGTLDDDSLDKTIDTLYELQEGGRLVGIISHVGELKERIAARLMIDKTEFGSRAYFEVGQ